MSDKTKQQTDRLLILREVSELANLPPNAIEFLCRRNEFPQPIRFHRRYLRWKESEVLAYLQNAPRGFE